MDVIVLVILTWQIGVMAKRKGYAPLRWRWMVVLSWLGLEVLGLLIGFSISGNVLLAALLGFVAAIGGYMMVRYRLERLPDINNDKDDFLERLGR